MPIIVLTGYADLDTVEACVATGAFDFLAKPFGQLELRAVLRRAFLRTGLPVVETLVESGEADASRTTPKV